MVGFVTVCPATFPENNKLDLIRALDTSDLPAKKMAVVIDGVQTLSKPPI